jgi:hypothetical protein
VDVQGDSTRKLVEFQPDFWFHSVQHQSKRGQVNAPARLDNWHSHD